MTRKPVFWIILVLASVGGVIFSYSYFSKAFPIVTLDITMDRASALSKAKELAETHDFGPEGYKQAASFGGDQEVQVFVELEAGGTEAFERMMRDGLYMPFTWRVRHYKEGEKREAQIRFKPDGVPYGFVIKLPENDPGAALTPDAALAIATKTATETWGIDLVRYQLVEKSQEVRPGGRIDHTFVYERPDVKIGEGFYRLRLAVGGDRLTELTHFVKVPEAFNRRYEEMRSANNLIGVSSSVAFALLYVVAGCGIGLFFLLRQRWVLWRTPLLWGVTIAFLQLLAGLNQWPLMWMDYDTAVSLQSFVVQQITFQIVSFILFSILFTISFMAAESLSRKAFPHHLQQWKLWSPDVASSKAVLGRTIAGYLLVAIFFAYEVALYFITTKTLGWWTPSDILFHPDVLATYFPWLTSVAVSAQAGFWEESLFRAVPLAGAALLGDRFGGRKWWIAGMMILQAIIFGGGHAGYANQPAYARVVELIIPSLMFGGIYLVFGLLPAVVLHFAFDVVWFALPLFVSATPGIWIDRTMVIVLTLLPLWIVLWSRVRMKQWSEIPESALNRSWTPPPLVEAAPAEEKVAAPQVHPSLLRYVPIAGFVGLALWIGLTKFEPDVPPLNVSRSQAEETAKQELKKRGIELPESWKVLATVHGSPDQQDRFIWREAGREQYRSLLGNFLGRPHWRVRFVTFEGDVAERAEEYIVHIDNEGVFRFKHQLPEGRPGATIGEQDARILAHLTLKGLFGIDGATLKEVSASPSKLKERTDWVFTFADTINYRLPLDGEARIAVQIAGDKVVDAHKFVHVPEEWARKERDERSLPRTLTTVMSVANALLVFAAMIVGIVFWSKKRFAAGTFFWVAGGMFILSVASSLNQLPGIISMFSTAQPYGTQLTMILASIGVVTIVVSAAIGLGAGLIHRWKENQVGLPLAVPWSWGISLGAIFSGLAAVMGVMTPSSSPLWPDYESLTTYVPLLDVSLDGVSRVITQTVVLSFVFLIVDRFTSSWTRRKAVFGSVLVLYGIVLMGSRSIETIPIWLVSGLVIGGLLLGAYVIVLRVNTTIVPIAVATTSVLSLLRQGFLQAYPSVLLNVSIGIVVTILVVWWLQRRLSRPTWM